MLLNRHTAIGLLIFLAFIVPISLAHANSFDIAVQIARDQIEDKYFPGRKGPELFDCSGLTQYAFRHVGIDLPAGVNKPDGGQAAAGILVVERADYEDNEGRISEDSARSIVAELRPGDLLLFANGSALARQGVIGHIGIYTGGTQFIHSYVDESVQEEDFVSGQKPARDDYGNPKYDASGNPILYHLRSIFVEARRLSPAPPGPSTKFGRGETVEVTKDGGGATIRDDAKWFNAVWFLGESAKTVAGTKGTVQSSPMFFSYINSETGELVENWYWDVDFEEGPDGWVAEEYLRATEPSFLRVLLKAENDYDNDGTIDSVNSYTVNANGDPTSRSYDYNNDGTIDIYFTYTYDANGNLTIREADYGADETIERVYFYSYDRNGYRIKEEHDSFNVGTIDEVYIYTNNANGNPTSKSMDYENDGTMDVIFTYTYDPNWLPYDTRHPWLWWDLGLIKKEQDDGADGTIDYTTVYNNTYDANGNLIAKESIDESIIWRVDFYTYDAYGNLTEDRVDLLNDGTIDWVFYYTWQQP